MKRDELCAHLTATQGVISRLVGGLSEKQMLTVPDGHRNNILWNLGHITNTLDTICYRHASKKAPMPESWVEMFKNGSSPADWESTPDIAGVTSAYASAGERSVADYGGGALDTFEGYELFPGYRLDSIGHAMTFHTFHQGVHLGVIQAMSKTIG